MIIGLDISTNVVGIALLNIDGSLHLLEHVDLEKTRTGLFDKANVVKDRLNNIKEKCIIDYIFIEEALVKFRPGKSSASTISTLLKFNGICSYISEEVFSKRPVFILAPHARKVCGITIDKKTKKAIGVKTIVMNHVVQMLGEKFEILRTRTGSVKPTTYDRADAFVTAYAGYKEFCTSR